MINTWIYFYHQTTGDVFVFISLFGPDEQKKVILQIVLFNPDYNVSVSDKQIVSIKTILQHNNCLV